MAAHKPTPLQIVFSHLAYTDVIRLRGVCRRWKEQVENWIANTSELTTSNLQNPADFVLFARLSSKHSIQTLATSFGVRNSMQLSNALSCCPILTHLNLTDSLLGPTFYPLLQPLKTATTLQILNLSKNGLASPEVQALAETARHLPNLTTIDLSYNLLRDEAGGRAVSAVLGSTLAHIRVLRVSHNALQDSGTSQLAVVLSGCLLEELDLSSNYIQSRGAAALSNSIMNSQIKMLRVQGNPIGADGTEAILRCIRVNKQLSVLMDFTQSDDISSASDTDALSDSEQPLLAQ